jgi:hypothetical protein
MIDFHKPHEPIKPGKSRRLDWSEAQCSLFVRRLTDPENTYHIATTLRGETLRHTSEFVSSEAAMEYGVLWIRERIRA